MGRKLGKLGYAVLFGVLTAMSGLAAVAGEPVGFLGLLFFGGGGAVYFWLNRAPRPARGAVVHGTLPGAERHTALATGVVFPGKRGYAVAVTLGAVVFVLTGGWLLALGIAGISGAPAGVQPRSVWLVAAGAAAVIVFGAFGVMGLRTVFGTPRGIALLPEGLYARAPAGSIWLRWDDLAGGSVAGTGASAYVALSARSAGAITLTGMNRRLHRLNRRRFRMDVGYPAGALTVPPELVLGAIHHYRANPAARARLADPSTADLGTLRGES